MNKEELEKEAIKRVDAFINNFSQDIKSTLYDRLNQEDVKDFLYALYIDSAEPREKRIAELEKVCEETQELLDKQTKIMGMENADLRERNQKLLESCEKTQELLDKQIEATYRLDKENTELKERADFWEERRNCLERRRSRLC